MVVIKREETSIKKDIYYPFEITDVEVGVTQYNYNRFHFQLTDPQSGKQQKIQISFPTSLGDYSKLTRFLKKLNLEIPVNVEIDTEWLRELIGTTGQTKLAAREVKNKETQEITGVFPDINTESIMQVNLSSLLNLKPFIYKSDSVGSVTVNFQSSNATTTPVNISSVASDILDKHTVNLESLLSPKTDTIIAEIINRIPDIKTVGSSPDVFVKVVNEIATQHNTETQKMINDIKNTNTYIVKEGKIFFR
jgi:hypothetical protein